MTEVDEHDELDGISREQLMNVIQAEASNDGAPDTENYVRHRQNGRVSVDTVVWPSAL